MQLGTASDDAVVTAIRFAFVLQPARSERFIGTCRARVSEMLLILSILRKRTSGCTSQEILYYYAINHCRTFPTSKYTLLQAVKSTHTHTHTHTERERERRVSHESLVCTVGV